MRNIAFLLTTILLLLSSCTPVSPPPRRIGDDIPDPTKLPNVVPTGDAEPAAFEFIPRTPESYWDGLDKEMPVELLVARLRDLLQQQANVDIVDAHLLLVEAFDEDADMRECRRRLKVLGDRVLALASPDTPPARSLELIKRVIHDEYGFRHELQVPGMDNSARSHMLSCLLLSGEGNCNSLTLLYLALGERLGLDVSMVLIPQHCFVRLRTASGVWNYETTQDGKLFAEHVYAFKCPLKGSRGVYLRSLTPREALAAQLATTFGVLLGWEGRYRESLALLDLAVELAPEFTQAWINRSTKLVHLDRPNEALVSADRALALNGHSASAWCARGRALRKLARTAEAVDAFEKALAHDGSHTGARVALAEALAESGQLTTALREINRVLNATPNDGAAMAQKLEILLAMGRDEEAEALRKHLLPDPLTPSGRLYGQATMLANAGHHRKAVPLFDESLRLDPNSYRCWHNKGNSLAVLKRFDEALECFAKSLKLNPDYAMGYAKKAQACVILGRLDEAEEAVSKAVELHPDNAYYARLQIEIKRQR